MSIAGLGEDIIMVTCLELKIMFISDLMSLFMVIDAFYHVLFGIIH